METERERVLPFDVGDTQLPAGQVQVQIAEDSQLLQESTLGGGAGMGVSGYSEGPESGVLPQNVLASASLVGRSTNVPPGVAHQSGNHPSSFQTSVVNHEQKIVSPEDRMFNFHRKYNRALLECIAIEKERVRLVNENAQLQDLISQFINGTRLTDDILAADNPLFVVNGR